VPPIHPLLICRTGAAPQRNFFDLPALLPRMAMAAEGAAKADGRHAPLGSGAAWAADTAQLWAVVEAARFCVRARLRSSFGGPMQTLEALEHMLLEVRRPRRAR